MSYENSLESYDNDDDGSSSDDSIPCCLSQDCEDVTCTTLLRYCFKNYNTSNDIMNDEIISYDCIGDIRRSEILPVGTLFIDYETYNTRSTLSYTGVTEVKYQGTGWPVSLETQK